MDINLRTSLTMHLRSNHYPPLPEEYVAWVEELLPKMQAAKAEDEFDISVWEERVQIPASVVATGVLPRTAEEQDGEVHVRLGDLVSAMHLDFYLEIEDDEKSE